VTQRVLKAVFFINNDLIKLARRFCPGWIIQVNGTFNLNVIQILLIDCLGINNTGKSFLFTFCFITSESSENWRFVLGCVGRVVFDKLPLPRVVITDQGLGLRACF
jgi:MULE transposase domain